MISRRNLLVCGKAALLLQVGNVFRRTASILRCILPYTHFLRGSVCCEWPFISVWYQRMISLEIIMYARKISNAFTSQLLYSHFRLPAKQSPPSCSTSSWLPSAGCCVKASCSISCWWWCLVISQRNGGSSSLLDGVSAYKHQSESTLHCSKWEAFQVELIDM